MNETEYQCVWIGEGDTSQVVTLTTIGSRSGIQRSWRESIIQTDFQLTTLLPILITYAPNERQSSRCMNSPVCVHVDCNIG